MIMSKSASSTTTRIKTNSNISVLYPGFSKPLNPLLKYVKLSFAISNDTNFKATRKVARGEVSTITY